MARNNAKRDLTAGKAGLDFQTITPQALTPDLIKQFESLPHRFKTKVAFGEGCWEWQAAKDRPGYGRFWSGSRERGIIMAHRWIYMELTGEDIDGLDVDHLCRNPGCVRIDHLEPVTRGDNMRRGKVCNNAGVCRSGRHEWIPENIMQDGSTKRCRPCRVEWDREYRRRRAAESQTTGKAAA